MQFSSSPRSTCITASSTSRAESTSGTATRPAASRSRRTESAGAAVDGFLFLVTGLHTGNVGLLIELHETPPSLEASGRKPSRQPSPRGHITCVSPSGPARGNGLWHWTSSTTGSGTARPGWTPRAVPTLALTQSPCSTVTACSSGQRARSPMPFSGRRQRWPATGTRHGCLPSRRPNAGGGQPTTAVAQAFDLAAVIAAKSTASVGRTVPYWGCIPSACADDQVSLVLDRSAPQLRLIEVADSDRGVVLAYQPLTVGCSDTTAGGPPSLDEKQPATRA